MMQSQPIPASRADDSPAETSGTAQLPPHLTVIPGGRWCAWRTIAVRAPGFPARMVLAMAGGEAGAAIDAFIESGMPLDAARTATLKEALDRDLEQVRRGGVQAGSDPRFREAIVWQNRKILRTAIDPFLQKPHTNNQNERTRTSIIARYLQRYCVKNDTIGFFGPVGWGQLVDTGPHARVTPGRDLMSSRAVALETWALDAVAEAIAARVDLRPWLAPRLLPFFALDGNLLLVPMSGPVPLPEQQARLLSMCNGDRSARALGEVAISDPAHALSSEAEVFALLEQAAGLGVLSWKLELPLSPQPDRLLRAKLQAIDDPEVREAALAPLDALIAAKDSVAAAASDWAALDAALARLEETFSAITGRAAARREGETYASRTILYEDTRRDLDVAIGPGFLGAVGPALSLVLESARWVSSELAVGYRKVLEDIYLEGVEATGSSEVDLASVFHRFEQLHMRPKERPIVAAVERELQRRWTALLDLDLDAKEVRHRSVDLAARVKEAFACSGMGWPGGYLNPDIMIAARGIDALNRGEYLTVLGEIHFYNTLRGALWVSQHPEPAELERMMGVDYPQPRVLPLESKEMSSYRLSVPLAAPGSRRLHLSPEPARGDMDQVIPIGEVLVYRAEGELRLKTRDGRQDFAAMELLGALLEVEASGGMVFVSTAPHVPRVVIDDLVISRERWTFPAKDVVLARKEGLLATFIEARRWARRHGIPRFVFARLANEVKPVFVDLDSPVYVDNFARLARKLVDLGDEAATVVVTEMLPSADQTWITDANGDTYTSELRLVALERSRSDLT